MRSLVALGYRGTNQGQGPTGLLALPLLVDKVLQLSQLWVQHKVPAWKENRHREREREESNEPERKKERGNRRSTVNVIIILFYALIMLFTGKTFFIFLLHKLFRVWEREGERRRRKRAMNECEMRPKRAAIKTYDASKFLTSHAAKPAGYYLPQLCSHKIR